MSKSILVVEDEPMLREIYQMVLTKEGYDVDLAEDGQVAVDKLLKGDRYYDLILLDIMMPKLNGIDVLKKIKAESSPARNTVVYLLTNLGQENIIKTAEDLGANGHLIKAQYLPSQLIEKIKEILNQNPYQSQTSVTPPSA